MSLKKGSSKKPDWLPDWNNVAEYPDPKQKKVSGRVWAWEFLRRNPRYPQLWEESAALPKPVDFIYHESFSDFDKRLKIKGRFEKEFGIGLPASPSTASTDPDFKWRPKFITQSPRYWILPVNRLDDDDFEMPEIDRRP